MKKIRIKIEERELTQPKQTIEKNLLSRSLHDTFDEAKVEWNIDTLIDSTSDDFSSRCELCNTPGLKYNFVLSNPNTGHTLRVGSTCIIRFGVGKGVYDAESGRVLLQNMADEILLMNDIQTLVQDVMVLNPDPGTLSRFCGKLQKIMSLKGISSPSDEQLKTVLWGNRPIDDKFKLMRMRMLWDKPGMIETRKVKRVRNQPVYREGSTFGHKRRTRVQTTLGMSSAYRNPHQNYK